MTGEQAYFLWEAGIRTPKDVVDAGYEVLCDVHQVGPNTAPRILEGANRLLSA